MGELGTVRIECEGATTVELDQLHGFQGDLKSLSEENYRKLRDEIIRDGFSEPISVWRNFKGHAEGKVFSLYILNGHQRLTTLRRMREEGWTIPPVPISFVDAPDEKAAKRKVLALTSNFGTMTDDGLVDFMKDAGLEFSDIASSFAFPEINFDEIAPRFNIAPINSGGGGGLPEPLEGEDEVPEPPKVAKSKRGELYLLDPYYECESCGSKFDYETGKNMTECPCG